MIETTTIAQGRAEWPIPVRKTRKRRDSRAGGIAYHSTSASRRHTPTSPIQAASPKSLSSRPYDAISAPSPPKPPDQYLNLNLDYFEFDGAGNGYSNYGPPVIHHHGHVDTSWFSSESEISYTLASNEPNSPQLFEHNTGASPKNGFSPQMSNTGPDTSWNGVIPRNSMSSDIDEFTMSDVQYESCGSFGSMVLSTPGTMDSSISGGFNFPVISGFGSTETTDQITDLELTSKSCAIVPSLFLLDILLYPAFGDGRCLE